MYSEKLLALEPLGTPAAIALATPGVHTFSKIVHSRQQVQRLLATITTAVVSTAPAVIQLLYRPTPGSATNQVVVGSLSIPGGATVGQCYVKDVALVSCAPGSQLVYNVSTAATASGAAVGGFESIDDPETLVNEPKYVAG